MSITENLNNLAQEIWKSAESLRGKFKAYEYQNIVLPMITLRRIECVLESFRKKELETIRGRFPNDSEDQLKVWLKKAEKEFRFYNTSEWAFKQLGEEDLQVLVDNFTAYLNAFSPNIKIIIDHFGFKETVLKLKKNGSLPTLVKQYAGLDLGLDKLSNLEMGYVYEELLRRFSEQSGEEAGEHFTPREVIRLMVDLLDIQLTEQQPTIFIYDPACGTGGMLSVAKKHVLDRITDLQQREKAEDKIILYGQELQPQNFAICEAEMLLKADKCHIKIGNSLIPYDISREDLGDQLNDGTEHRFDYMLSNPPFGVTWSDYKTQAEKLNTTRYKAGMPRSNDGALLFLQTMLDKIKPVAQGGSKIAVVFNGSPLSNGDCGSGESEIRRWIIENNWLDAIVMLPDQLFYNTGIYTYIWLLSNNKPDSHNKQIKIIDAREQSEKEPKSFGNKRNRMTEAHLQWIKDAYNQHWQTEAHPQIKLFKSTDFAYHKVSVVFWQTDEHDQPAFITEPYEKDLTAANIKRELDFYDSEITFTGVVLLDDKEQPFKLTLKPNDSFTTCYHKQLKSLFKAELAEALKGIDKDQTKIEKAFLKSIIALKISFYHRHYVQDNEYIPYGEDIETFLQREIAKPIIRWQDSDQLGYEILPNKYFYHYQAPKPTAELLKDFWALENDAVNLIKSLEES